MTKNADIIVDLQFGSTGKGLIAGYLAVQNEYDVVINANMPNAGHTFIDSRGSKMIHKVLPNGVVSPKCRWALLGPGSVFSIDQLMDELTLLDWYGYNEFKVGIHPNAVPLTSEHKRLEERMIADIGSTKQGSVEAMIHKLRREVNSNPTMANNMSRLPWGERIKVLPHESYRNIIKSADRMLLEGAQGFSLGINQEFYPYCTSRECTPTRFLSDMGVPINYYNHIIGVCRVHPIRVGGNSGGWYTDQEELTWEDIGVEEERTTVTKRVRRVATWSDHQIRDALWETGAQSIFLNFCNYAKPHELLHIRNEIGDMIQYEGWGATVNDVKEVCHG